MNMGYVKWARMNGIDPRHPTSFDEYLQQNNPNLREELVNKKITKKFYVGSPKMNPLGSDGSSYAMWAKDTLEKAVQNAKELCEETGEPQIVVQIVRVVKPQKVPILVEKV
jgi:hypothetical protein